MKYPRFFIILLFLFLSLTGSAAAIEEIHQENIKSFDLTAPDGLQLEGFSVFNLPGDSNNTYTLDAYGKIYTFDINCSKHFGWWTYDLKLQHPNGTIESTQVETFAPLATDYDIHLQYYLLETDTVFDVDIYASLLPLSATFQTTDPTAYNILAFSEISGSSTDYFNLVIYAMTDEEFQAAYDSEIGTQISHAAGEFFAWTWAGVLAFVEIIPGVGPYLATSLELAALTIDGVFFYFNLLFIEFAETTFITIEALIWTYGITGFKRGGLFGCLKRVCNTHMQIIETGFNLAQGSISITFRIFEGIAAIVQALKP